ncbi:MAG: 2-(1,2-epoxy-1,2-dihydrophenyl)acetyl-CoA isomerase [Proteobacteria bacterium]|nr:2-(1,2-epoxy-1,2-dihydrophenyl)acetyl-CoA isomerase [Pseudomonadota bacterium]
MTWTTIGYDEADGVAAITLNRPDKLNSFTPELHRELAAALDQAERDDGVRALLLTGAGRAFCAGQDLSSLDMPTVGDTIERLYNKLVRRLRDLPKPIVCAVNGVAAGAGANLALACDIVLAARSASFIQAFCKIGLVPDTGGTYVLPRLVGSARALALALTGEPVSGEQAAAWGMIWRAVDDAQLMDEARALARRLAAGATKGLGLTKQALNRSLANDLDAQLAVERDLQIAASRTEDCREGIAAFLAKRPPVFTGR